MKTKYDWSKVPEEITAIATCKDGTVKWFSKPKLCNDYWISVFTVTGAEPYKGNWMDSLEERPK